MSLNKEPANVLKSATAEPSAARLATGTPATTSSEPGSHLEETSAAGQPKPAKRKAAARTNGGALAALGNPLPKATAREQKRAVGLIRRPATEDIAKANRENSLKCTGPVTDLGKVNARLNAMKHGITSVVAGLVLPQLGELSGDLRSIDDNLWKAFGPHDHFEALLVKQMVENRWRRRRLVRAESSLLAAQSLQCELEYGQKLAGEGRSQGGIGEARLAAASGLVALPDSSAKFNLILQCLRAAEEAVRQEGFGAEGLRRLETVYGPDPGLAGAVLLSNYRRQTNAEGTEDAAPNTPSRQIFLEMLAGEIACFEKLLELHETTAVRLAYAHAGAQHALSASDTQRFTRYETFLDRQFERLVKQFNEWRSANRP